MSSKHPKPGGDKQHSQPNQNSGQEQQRKISGDIHVRGEIEANVPESFIEKYKAARNEQTPRDNARFIVECATLGLVFIYAGLTAWQAKTTQDIANLTKTQFTFSERPYVLVPGATLVEPPPGVRNKIGANFSYTNYGKSPALHIMIKSGIFRGENAFTDAGKFYDSLGTERFKKSPYGETVLAPGGGKDNSGYSTLVTRDFPDPAEIVSDLDHDFQVVILAKIQYTDIPGNPYETIFCSAHLATGAWALCPKYNDVK